LKTFFEAEFLDDSQTSTRLKIRSKTRLEKLFQKTFSKMPEKVPETPIFDVTNARIPGWPATLGI
jgi:hypothetical protein